MHGNLNHIGFFIAQVEHNYHKHYTVRNGWGDYVRPVAMLVVWRFAGIKKVEVTRYFKCDRAGVQLSIKRQLGYEKTGNPSFILHYNQLLQLYIDVTKFYIKRKKFIKL